jgi:HEPN domain-containing protein
MESGLTTESVLAHHRKLLDDAKTSLQETMERCSRFLDFYELTTRYDVAVKEVPDASSRESAASCVDGFMAAYAVIVERLEEGQKLE